MSKQTFEEMIAGIICRTFNEAIEEAVTNATASTAPKRADETAARLSDEPLTAARLSEVIRKMTTPRVGVIVASNTVEPGTVYRIYPKQNRLTAFVDNTPDLMIVVHSDQFDEVVDVSGARKTKAGRFEFMFYDDDIGPPPPGNASQVVNMDPGS